jgi:hypothetical protein
MLAVNFDPQKINPINKISKYKKIEMSEFNLNKKWMLKAEAQNVSLFRTKKRILF